jgi:hypothetical protein
LNMTIAKVLLPLPVLSRKVSTFDYPNFFQIKNKQITEKKNLPTRIQLNKHDKRDFYNNFFVRKQYNIFFCQQPLDIRQMPYIVGEQRCKTIKCRLKRNENSYSLLFIPTHVPNSQNTKGIYTMYIPSTYTYNFSTPKTSKIGIFQHTKMKI